MSAKSICQQMVHGEMEDTGLYVKSRTDVQVAFWCLSRLKSKYEQSNYAGRTVMAYSGPANQPRVYERIHANRQAVNRHTNRPTSK